MLHYKNRKRKIHIATMDPVLAVDIRRRLAEYRGTGSAELVTPKENGDQISVRDVDNLALDSRSASVIIIDVRRQTLTRLQQAYNKIVRYNRPDLNTYCYAVLIGEGPRSVPHDGDTLGAFQKYLADMRTDYHPAVFFADPFMRYSREEIQELVLYEGTLLPEKLPEKLRKHFKRDDMTVEQARAYFRAAGVPAKEKAAARKRRQTRLAKFYHRIINEEFPDHAEQLKRSLTREGCSLPGESLKLHTYPFHFERLVRALLHKKKAAARS